MLLAIFRIFPAVRLCGDEAALLVRMLRGDRPTVVAALIILAVTLSLLLLFLLMALLSEWSDFALILWGMLHVEEEDNVTANYSAGLAFLSAGAFLVSSLATSSRILLALALLFGFVWFDDSASFHERLGGILVDRLGLPEGIGLSGQDFGEILAWLIAAGPLAAVFVWAWWGRRPGDSGIATAAATLFGFLFFFGFVVDMIHAAVPPRLDVVVGFIEDAGEILTLAATAAFALGMLRIADAYRVATAEARPGNKLRAWEA